MTDLELYNRAKQAYYDGSPIMEDFEFDELENRLGLENRSYIGARHNPSYTIKHPFIMGSLSKVQIKQDSNGYIDWNEYLGQVKKYVGSNLLIVTPKYDGCSFEMYFENKKLVSVSTRGDGEYGKDIKLHLSYISKRIEAEAEKYLECEPTVLRGEVLIDKTVFKEKYSDFVNPRSFVSGLLNRDYDENDIHLTEMLKDLSIVIYDVREKINGQWEDIGWIRFKSLFSDIPEFAFDFEQINSDIALKRLYERFEDYRNNKCRFALDGIVLKPIDHMRKNDLTEIRPKDCVAIKFIPMLQETEVVDIEWTTGKTNELRPVIIVNPVTMDGKTITRASAHNYGYLLNNKISIGTKVILSLAGDIIPFIYKITNTDNFDASRMNLPLSNVSVEGCHIIKGMTEEEKLKQKFVQSASVLGIPQIGPAIASSIYDWLFYDYMPDEFIGSEGKPMPNNILLCNDTELYNALGGGKSAANVSKAFAEFKKNLTLKDVILSCTFDSCGNRASAAIEDYLLNGTENFEHIPEKAYKWAKDTQSTEYKQLMHVICGCGKTIDMFRQEKQYMNKNAIEQIPVILTGEPNDYASKGDFLSKHPEYKQTTSWKDVQIVFTNSLESKTGKMKKAIEKGITIKLY